MDKPSPAYAVSTTRGADVVRWREPKMAQAALEALQKDLARRIDAGSRRMVFNLAPVTFVDSFGIGVIAATARRMAQEGGKLVLCGVGDRVKMSLTITRLDRTLAILADEEEALRRLGGEE